MFKPVASKVSFPKLEEDVLQFWKEQDTFRKSVSQREGSPQFTFYEGPPTANGVPGIHHVLARIFKDIIPRYKTMQGFQVPRKGGWDTHGLPVELEVERELGISSKLEIEAYGIERFNQMCKESVFKYVHQWEAMTDRIAFWVDMEDAYVTFYNEYIETGWWIIKQLWDKGLVYRGYKTTPHCPRCGTSLSSHEVALGYNENTVDPSVYVKFRVAPNTGGWSTSSENGALLRRVLLDEQVPSYVLAWTTTPWTLPGNTATAVAPNAAYLVIERTLPEALEGAVRQGDTERIVLAEALAPAVFAGEEYTILAKVTGADLVGLRYQPLFDPVALGFPLQRFTSASGELFPYRHAEAEPLTYAVIGGDFVSMEDGTGIVHIAPAFGEDDFEIGKREGLFFIQHVDLKGEILPASVPWAGKFVKDADPIITRDLQERGQLLREGKITHTYPFCWRCSTPLLYYVKPSWYIRTTAVKQKLVDSNALIHWYPEHIREGRYGNWLENNVDWAISRERYWGTPLPIWQCPSCSHQECVGSRAELQAKQGLLGYSEDTELHRPYVDGVVFSCSQCGAPMERQKDVLDCWFDSGAMPYAQWHFPVENKDTFQSWFPADYICEAVDQTRGWFYTLHALATLLNSVAPDLVPQPISYRNVICLGLILDGKGEKMSKSKGNVVDPWSVLNLHGADALRWYLYTASPAGNPRRFSADLVGESLRKFLLTLWNTYSFFVTYANIDDYDPKAVHGDLPYSELDRWVRSELNTLIEEVSTALEAYNPTDAGRRIQEFVEDLSNWYVRRSRRRFWKTENDADKLAAYDTLYTCLVTLSKLLAPFTPFVAEELYQNLVRSVDAGAPESVHLANYPDADIDAIDADLNRDTRLVMRLVSLGRAARSKAGVKVRQPLGSALFRVRTSAEASALQRLSDQVAEELNVKEVKATQSLDTYALSKVTFNTKTYGQNFGRDLPQLLPEIAKLEPEAVQQAGDTLRVGQWDVPRAALNVEYTARPGYAVAGDAGYVAVCATEVTAELAAEGLARELVHRIQNMRRDAGFDIADHIETFYEAGAEVAQVMTAHEEYVRQETLSDRVAAERRPLRRLHRVARSGRPQHPPVPSAGIR